MQQPASKRQAILSQLTIEEKAALYYRWPFWAREAQLPPAGDWQVWLVRAGRGFGKTRCGAEWVRSGVESGRFGRIALVGPTAADARDVMVEGDSGLMSICPPWNRPTYEPSKRRVTWPNGAMAVLYSAEEPDRLRGPQHAAAWCDEIASWSEPAAWDMLMFGLRLGERPQVVVTTTPKPTKLVKEVMGDPNTVETRGTSYENRLNLAPAFFDQIVRKYEGTRLGRQELLAELLDDNPYALWHREAIDQARVAAAPSLSRIVVAIDPAVTANEDSDETGIVAAGKTADGQYYVLADRSMRGSPKQWASAAVGLYQRYEADRIVAEVNNGGDMVCDTIRAVDRNASYKEVRATRGKLIRAEPIAALYEQGRVHHVGSFPMLEDQLVDWVPGDPSPDRLDALVWALSELSTGATWIPVALSGEARAA